MYAAASDLLALDVVKLLVEHGADVNARDATSKRGDSGLTVLDIAKLHGETPVVDLLVKIRRQGLGAQNPPALQARRENTIQSAIQGSLPVDPAGGREFRSQGGLRFLPQQQLCGDGGRRRAQERIPGG